VIFVEEKKNMLITHGLSTDVIGYFIFWTLVFAFEFLNYLKTDFDWNFMSDVS
jgi:hypothetical protein